MARRAAARRIPPDVRWLWHPGQMIDWTAITAVIGSIATVSGAFGGYVLAGQNEEARDIRADQREVRARRAALAERLEEERHTFQRDTLLELQDVLLELSRWSGLVITQDVKTLKEQGKLSQLPDGLGGEEPRLLVASAQRLRTRVLDDDLRHAIGDFITLCTRFSSGLAKVEAGEIIRELHRRDRAAVTAYDDLAEKIGEHLRRELDRRILVNELDTPS